MVESVAILAQDGWCRGAAQMAVSDQDCMRMCYASPAIMRHLRTPLLTQMVLAMRNLEDLLSEPITTPVEAMDLKDARKRVVAVCDALAAETQAALDDEASSDAVGGAVGDETASEAVGGTVDEVSEAVGGDMDEKASEALGGVDECFRGVGSVDEAWSEAVAAWTKASEAVGGVDEAEGFRGVGSVDEAFRGRGRRHGREGLRGVGSVDEMASEAVGGVDEASDSEAVGGAVDEKTSEAVGGVDEASDSEAVGGAVDEKASEVVGSVDDEASDAVGGMDEASEAVGGEASEAVDSAGKRRQKPWAWARPWPLKRPWTGKPRQPATLPPGWPIGAPLPKKRPRRAAV